MKNNLLLSIILLVLGSYNVIDGSVLARAIKTVIRKNAHVTRLAMPVRAAFINIHTTPTGHGTHGTWTHKWAGEQKNLQVKMEVMGRGLENTKTELHDLRHEVVQQHEGNTMVQRLTVAWVEKLQSQMIELQNRVSNLEHPRHNKK